MSNPSYLDELVHDTPTQRLRSDDGENVLEPLVIVATIDAPADRREQLELYGICMDHAEHDRANGTWTPCLLSEPCLQMLTELCTEDQFPYKVLTSLSQAEAEWRIAQRAGATERPPVPLRAYVTAASIEALARLQATTDDRK